MPGALAGLPTHAEVSYYLNNHPDEVQQIAMALKIPLLTAAMILAAQAQGVPAMAEGGYATGPTLVGERGPEIFTPAAPGTITPLPGALGFHDIPPPGHGGLHQWEYGLNFPNVKIPNDYLLDTSQGVGERVNPEHWDTWLAAMPESENVEDRRTPEQRAKDNADLYRWNRQSQKGNKLRGYKPLQAQGIPAMAEGGYATGPTLVGERGPEVFTPSVPGTIAPAARSTNAWTPPATPAWPTTNDWIGYEPLPYGPRVKIKPASWDTWLESRPESENVEDRRGMPHHKEHK